MVERCGAQEAVCAALAPAADDLDDLAAPEFGDDDPVVVGVGNEQAATLGVGQHLAGKGQSRCREAFPFELAIERTAIDLPFELDDQRVEDGLEQVVDPLPAVRTNDVAGRVNNGQRWPRLGSPKAPHLEVGVVDHRMLEPVAKNDLADVVGIALVVEFRRMHTDHDEFVGELRFQSFEVGNDVDAVDASVRPEIEDHDLAAQLLEGQGTVGIQPIEPGRELGSWCRTCVALHGCVGGRAGICDTRDRSRRVRGSIGLRTTRQNDQTHHEQRQQIPGSSHNPNSLPGSRK